MRADDAVVSEKERRPDFIRRAEEELDRAHRCLTFARIARLKGDCGVVAMWLQQARALRKAAARWRNRARGITSTQGRTPAGIRRGLC